MGQLLDWAKQNKIGALCAAVAVLASLPFVLGGIGLGIVRLVSELVVPCGLLYILLYRVFR